MVLQVPNDANMQLARLRLTMEQLKEDWVEDKEDKDLSLAMVVLRCISRHLSSLVANSSHQDWPISNLGHSSNNRNNLLISSQVTESMVVVVLLNMVVSLKDPSTASNPKVVLDRRSVLWQINSGRWEWAERNRSNCTPPIS